MSNHTTTLRNIIYHYSQDFNPLFPPDEKRYHFIRFEDEMSVIERIEKARPKMLYNTNKFFNEKFKNAFFQQFCIDNLMREIEYETTEYFILKFNQNVSRWLPVYNKLYETSLLELDKLKSYSKESVRAGGRETSANGESTSENNNKNVFNDTPENRLTNADYATTITVDEGRGNGTTSSNGKEDYTENYTESGYNVPQAELILKYRETLMDVVGKFSDTVSRTLFSKIY